MEMDSSERPAIHISKDAVTLSIHDLQIFHQEIISTSPLIGTCMKSFVVTSIDVIDIINRESSNRDISRSFKIPGLTECRCCWTRNCYTDSFSFDDRRIS